MARKYYHAGPASQEGQYETLTVWKVKFMSGERCLAFQTQGDPVLCYDQVRDLREQLQVWLGERCPKPVESPVMMEGEL